MELDWRQVWEMGIAPHLSTEKLRHLADALESDDPALIQGEMTLPPVVNSDPKSPICAACAIIYGDWKTERIRTVGDAEEYFDEITDACDASLERRYSYPDFVRWFDRTPRAEMRELLLTLVRQILRERECA